METTSRKLVKMLNRDGFEFVSAKGSHHKFKKDSVVVIVPHPKKDLPVGTVRAIYRQVGWL